MGKLLCLEIPVDESANMIQVMLRNSDDEIDSILVQHCSKSDFQFALENNKYITFDSLAYIASTECLTDEHCWLFKLVEPGWIENVGFKIDRIISYRYL